MSGNVETTNVISLRRLARPVTSCVLLLLLSSVSTGPLIRELFTLTLSDLLAFTVGLLWLLGDVLPCIAIIVTIHDILFIGKRDATYIVIKGRRITLPELILATFCILYLVDFILTVTGYSRLDNYRHGFFHFQVLISILYLAKPWFWSRLDLRDIVARLERFYLLSYRMAESISMYLRGSRSGEEPLVDATQPQEEHLNVVQNSKTPHSFSLDNLEPLKSTTQVKTTRLQRVSLGATRSVKRGPENVRRRVSRSRTTSLSARGQTKSSSAKQTVIMRFGRRSDTSARRRGKSLRSSRRLRINSVGSESTRTVNLNLNMN